jgi:hypothetical protein
MPTFGHGTPWSAVARLLAQGNPAKRNPSAIAQSAMSRTSDPIRGVMRALVDGLLLIRHSLVRSHGQEALPVRLTPQLLQTPSAVLLTTWLSTIDLKHAVSGRQPQWRLLVSSSYVDDTRALREVISLNMGISHVAFKTISAHPESSRACRFTAQDANVKLAQWLSSSSPAE